MVSVTVCGQVHDARPSPSSQGRVWMMEAFWRRQRVSQASLSHHTFVPTAIPALQPIVHDLFVLRGTNKADAGKELETQKEVVVSMLLRLVQYHQVRGGCRAAAGPSPSRRHTGKCQVATACQAAQCCFTPALGSRVGRRGGGGAVWRGSVSKAVQPGRQPPGRKRQALFSKQGPKVN